MPGINPSDLIHERLAAIVDSSNDAIISKDLEGIIQSWNDAAQRIFGYSAKEMIGRSITRLSPPERKDEEPVILSRLKRGEHIDHFQTVRLHKDGHRIDVSVSVSPLKDAAGNIIGASNITRDITEFQALMKEREALLAAERAARGEAERTNRLKDEFLSTLSHELRTPLNAILGWTQLMRQSSGDWETLQEGLDIIERNARSQTRLIADLLDMSRIISGKLRLDFQHTDLAAVVEAAVDSVRPMAQTRGVELHETLEPFAGPIDGDPHRLQQIVWNLLTNAIKFTPQGGRVDISLQRHGSCVEVSVHDTGQGIKAEFLPHVFDRFRQADSTLTRHHGGLGLGLAIVKHLAELHGGTVQAASTGEGQGATFIVELPIAREPDARTGATWNTGLAPVDLQRISLRGLKALVVDDEPDARELIRRLLAERQSRVLTADCADRALELLKEESPDILISDIGMPNKDGYQLIREVRRLPPEQNGRIPAIALTALARSEDRTRAMMAGYQVHLAKPIESQELIAAVASTLGRTGTAAAS